MLIQRDLRQCSLRYFRDGAQTKLAMPQKEDSHEADSTRSVHRTIHDQFTEQFFNGFVVKRWICATFLRASSPDLGEESLDAQAGDCTSNDQLLNLRSTFKDGVNLGVTVHALNVILAGVPITTKNLNCFFGYAHCGF